MLDKTKIIGIIGPSGVGKSTIVKILIENTGLPLIKTVTDRPRRKLEEPFEHEFISPQEFDEREKRGEFLVVVNPFELPYRYAFPDILNEDKVMVLMFRAEFLGLLKKYFKHYIIYQIEADKEHAEKAISKRGPKEELGSRLSQFEREVEQGRAIAKRVFEHDMSSPEAVAERIKQAIDEDLVAAF
jgi:guanylate kinase